jgi:Mrp family chromosome partitioning ATPase
MLAALSPDPDHLLRHRIVSPTKADPAHVAFDVLRTRILSVCRENGWRRVGITSPTKGCGKSTIGLNLAYSLARQSGIRVLLVDLDLRNPHLARMLGAADPPDIVEFLAGQVPAETFLRRIDSNLIVGLNGRRERNSAELLQVPDTARRLAEAASAVAADIVIYDLPPALAGDDVIGFLPSLDCLMMVVAAGQTQPDELREAERMIEGSTNFLGVLLNRAAETAAEYRYDYPA